MALNLPADSPRYHSRLDDIITRVHTDEQPRVPMCFVRTAILDKFFSELRASLLLFSDQRHQARSQAEWNVAISWCYERALTIVGERPRPMTPLEQIESQDEDYTCKFVERKLAAFSEAQFENETFKNAFRRVYAEVLSFDYMNNHFQATLVPASENSFSAPAMQAASSTPQSQAQHANTSLGSARHTFSSRTQSHAERALESARQAAAAATQFNPRIQLASSREEAQIEPPTPCRTHEEDPILSNRIRYPVRSHNPRTQYNGVEFGK